MHEVNTLGTVRVTKAFLPLLRESQGRVVCVASMAGILNILKTQSYALKFSLRFSYRTSYCPRFHSLLNVKVCCCSLCRRTETRNA